MKKLLIISASLLVSGFVQAQPWMKNFSSGHVKLQDVVNAWKSDPSNYNEADNEEAEEKGEENKNYQFDRWYDYWQSHTDENGYMVFPQRTLREWVAYKDQHRLNGARTTATLPKWTFQGPFVTNNTGKNGEGIGRIQVVGYHPTDTNTFWIGSAGGGAWRTTDGGMTWTCMTDNTYPLRGVADIKYNPLNPNVVYIATGDRDAQDSYSIGILKSHDGGLTWDTTGLTKPENYGLLTNSLVINPLDTNTIFVASNAGMYRSLDGGTTFTLVQVGNFMRVAYNPADTTILYASGSGNFFRSADGGSTWAQITSITASIRMEFAVTPQNPGIIKAITTNSSYGLEGIYSSSDTGKTFSRIYNADAGCNYNILSFDPKLKTSSCGGQGWYDLCIVINPLDSNSVYIGGVNNWHSIDGGHTWIISNQWTGTISGLEVVHADKHYLGYNPIAPNYIFETNDGGVYRSSYRSVPDTNDAYWTDLSNGICITQFYRIAVSDNANFVLGGAQDNGSKQVFTDSTHQPGGADGMTCQIDPTNPNIFYTSIQYGSPISITSDGGLHSRNISKHIAATPPTGLWTTPFVLDPLNHLTIFAGYNNLYYSNDSGAHWFTYPTFPSGGSVSRIVVYPFDDNFIYALSGNLIRYTSDGGATWSSQSAFYGNASDIAVDPNDPQHIWITYSGYSANKVADFHADTKKIALQNGSLPAVPVNCIAIDNSNGTKYIGTEVAVFYRDSTMPDWELYNNGLPVVRINDLKINYSTGEIWAGTYGRGMWKTTKYEPSFISIVPFVQGVIKTYPNPSKGQFKVVTQNQVFFNKAVQSRLINTMGQTIWQGRGTFSGNGLLEINAGMAPRGNYIFEVSDGLNVARTTVVILQ
jgi:photosystem II stability/assembly factor-like uncharacterized protein